MAAPPHARVGERAASAGRPIVAGIAPFLRSLPARATAADLWAGVEALTVEGDGRERLARRHGTRIDQPAHRRFAAFVRQAEQYYAAVGPLDPAAKPLIAYYFALNLTKAYLTSVDPTSTAGTRLGHGLGESFDEKRRYFFQHEGFRIQARGLFRDLAESTGQRFCYAANHRLRLIDLLPYLPEAFDLYADAADEAPRLLPIADAYALFGEKQGWLRVEIDRNVLRQRGLGPETLLNRARIFGTAFHLVADADVPTASYESNDRYAYGNKRSEILEYLCDVYEQGLFACHRATAGGRRFIVLSERTQLLSHEAVTFAVLHHLSNMVRYRPQYVERLRGSRFFWLFASWVDRACGNLLLSLASRITREEHIVF
jgi:YaaC-like protein